MTEQSKKTQTLSVIGLDGNKQQYYDQLYYTRYVCYIFYIFY